MLKRQRAEEGAEEAIPQDFMRGYSRVKPFPEKSGEWEDV